MANISLFHFLQMILTNRVMLHLCSHAVILSASQRHVYLICICKMELDESHCLGLYGFFLPHFSFCLLFTVMSSFCLSFHRIQVSLFRFAKKPSFVLFSYTHCDYHAHCDLTLYSSQEIHSKNCGTLHLTLSHLHSCCFVQLLMGHPIWVHLGLLRYYHSFFLPTGSSNSNCTHLWENYILQKLVKYKQALKNIISFVWNHLWFALILERGFV